MIARTVCDFEGELGTTTNKTTKAGVVCFHHGVFADQQRLPLRPSVLYGHLQGPAAKPADPFHKIMDGQCVEFRRIRRYARYPCDFPGDLVVRCPSENIGHVFCLGPCGVDRRAVEFAQMGHQDTQLSTHRLHGLGDLLAGHF